MLVPRPFFIMQKCKKSAKIVGRFFRDYAAKVSDFSNFLKTFTNNDPSKLEVGCINRTYEIFGELTTTMSTNHQVGFFGFETSF